MRAWQRQLKKGVLGVVPLVIMGCGFIPLVPVVLPLSATVLTVLAVSAGVPALQGGTITIGESEATSLIGRGNLELDPSAITLRSTTTGGKVNRTAQQAIACSGACLAAGVSADRCDDVCDESQLEVTIWIAAAADESTVCTGGERDEYGPYLVGLDENGNAVSVSPSTVELGALTISQIEAGTLAACIRVIAPDDGEVVIDSLTLNVGL